MGFFILYRTLVYFGVYNNNGVLIVFCGLFLLIDIIGVSEELWLALFVRGKVVLVWFSMLVLTCSILKIGLGTIIAKHKH